MKVLRLFLVLIAFLALTTMQAEPKWSTSPYPGILIADEDPKPEPAVLTPALRMEIINLMDIHEFDLKKDLLARVVFTLNKKNEIVVLYVLSNNRDIDYYVKTKLNYKKVNITTNSDGGVYHLPLRFTPQTREEYNANNNKKMDKQEEEKFKKYQI